MTDVISRGGVFAIMGACFEAHKVNVNFAANGDLSRRTTR
jgi:hypothetical protein